MAISKKSTKLTFSGRKLLVGLSLTLNLAFIVLITTILNTTYFDFSILNQTLTRNLDINGCYIGLPKSDQYTNLCLTWYSVDANGVILTPEWLKGQTPAE